MNPTSNDMSNTAEREIVINRLLDAPRELVFEAYTNPKHIGNWWGPHGFTTTTIEMDAQPGGVWRYIMHGPDGTDYPSKIVYIDVVKPELLTYLHGSDVEVDPSQFHVTVKFEEQDGKTNLTQRALFPTAEVRQQMVEKYRAIEGLNQTIDRLVEYLGTI